jgi:hypothetical protein
MRPPISSSLKYSGNMWWNEMAQDEIWWVGFLASNADSSDSDIGVSNVYSPLSLMLFLCPQPTQFHVVCRPPTYSHDVSVSTAQSLSCCFYVYCPVSLMLLLCPLQSVSCASMSTQSLAVSLSTTLSVSCFYSQCPLSLLLILCPLPTNSRAVALSTAHSVSCYFCVCCSHGAMLFLCPLSDVEGTLLCSTKVSVRWLALLLPIHEATASNPALVTGQKSKHFVVSLNSSR